MLWMAIGLFSSHPYHPAGYMVFAVHNFNGTICKIVKPTMKNRISWRLLQSNMTFTCSMFIIQWQHMSWTYFFHQIVSGKLADAVVVTEVLRYLGTHSFIWRNFFFTDYDYFAGGTYAHTQCERESEREKKTCKCIQLQDVTRVNINISKTKITKKKKEEERETQGETKITGRESRHCHSFESQWKSLHKEVEK